MTNFLRSLVISALVIFWALTVGELAALVIFWALTVGGLANWLAR